MKKSKNVKVKKSSPKRGAAPDPELPSLVTGMTKLVERLEILERKMDQVLSRVSNLPSEIRNAGQVSRPQPSHQPQPFQPRSEQHHSGSQPHGQENRSERRMFQAICADCHKNCEVPFKPGERPVYCKECFGKRRSGNAPKVNEPKPVVPFVQPVAPAVVASKSPAPKKKSSPPKKPAAKKKVVVKKKAKKK